MKQNILQNVIGFILKYIWIFCSILIILELASVTYTAGILMQQTALGVIQSVSGDVSGRVDGVLRLLKGMAADERFADTSKPLFDRAIQALPYQTEYELYMIALTDQDVNVISADETAPPTENYSLAYRDYMQRLYSTGEYQITDAFLSGDGKKTMNYTIAVPIIKDGTVEGSIFGSIFFQDIADIINQQSFHNGRDFYLLGENNTVMAGDEGQINGKSFLELSGKSYIINDDVESIDASLQAGASGDFWEWDQEGLTYVTYQRVPPTHWTIIYRIQFFSVFVKLIPILCIKIFFYVVMCCGIYFFGRKYLNRQLAQINHMLNRMALMQKELFHSEQMDYNNLLELTQQGLSDQLTGLCTRAILFKKMTQLTDASDFHGAVVFIDLDDLKQINDNYGHEGGDCALLHFAKILKAYEEKYNGIASRYGGDEFVFVFHCPTDKPASIIIPALCRELHTTISVKEHSFSIHGSIGVSFYPEHGTTLEELICKADLALYTAKQNGKNQYAFFSETTSLV